MFAALISFAPLIACPLGMLAMMGIPALARRARNRRRTVHRASPPLAAARSAGPDQAEGS